MNNNTAMFCDRMNLFNRMAASFGFGSGKNWAEQAYRMGKITAYEIMQIRNFHKLHTQILQGNARNVSVCYEDVEDLKNYISLMERGGAQNHNKRRPPRLPEGTFRSRPYIKEFYRNSDRYQYYFKFAVVWEENYVATEIGGIEGEVGYFIHILDAPYLEYAKEDLHKFHIITNGDDDQYICWDQAIQEFEQANAVMFVWVNRYTELISSLYCFAIVLQKILSLFIQRALISHLL